MATVKREQWVVRDGKRVREMVDVTDSGRFSVNGKRDSLRVNHQKALAAVEPQLVSVVNRPPRRWDNKVKPRNIKEFDLKSVMTDIKANQKVKHQRYLDEHKNDKPETFQPSTKKPRITSWHGTTKRS